VSPGADVAVAAGARPGSRKRKAGTDEAMRSLAAAADGIPEGFRSGLPWKGRRSLHQFKHYLYSHHEVGNFPRVAPNGRPAARSVRDPLGDGWRLNDTRLFSTLNIGESATGPAYTICRPPAPPIQTLFPTPHPVARDSSLRLAPSPAARRPSHRLLWPCPG
jgi:hypothetical protein